MKLVRLSESSENDDLKKVQQLFRSYNGRKITGNGDTVYCDSLSEGSRPKLFLYCKADYNKGSLRRYVSITYYSEYGKTDIEVVCNESEYAEVYHKFKKAQNEINRRTGAKFGMVEFVYGNYMDGIPTKRTIDICADIVSTLY